MRGEINVPLQLAIETTTFASRVFASSCAPQIASLEVPMFSPSRGSSSLLQANAEALSIDAVTIPMYVLCFERQFILLISSTPVRAKG
jgi:hypothetical protein